MAKDLSLQPGVNNADANFLNGKLVNNETLAGEGINQDIVQFFQKLMSDAGLAANGDEDNELNGYQFITALDSFIGAHDSKIPWVSLTMLNTWTGVLKARVIDGYIELIGKDLDPENATSDVVVDLVTTYKPDNPTSEGLTDQGDSISIFTAGSGAVSIDRSGIGAGDTRGFYMKFLKTFP